MGVLQLLTSVGGGVTYDSDAEAYFTAASISDTTFKNAYNTYVLTGKSQGWYAKLEVILPMPGGSAAQHAVNAKQPGTFDITWAGTAATHNSNGVTGNGTDSYGDTNYNQSTHGAEDDEHFSVYSRTNSDGAPVSMGVVGASGGSRITLRQVDFTNSRSQNSATTQTANTSSLGYFSVNRTAGAGYRVRRNATNTDITSASDVAVVNRNFYILCFNNNGTAANFSARNYCFFALGQGLTETEDSNHRTAVEALQDALSRGVI